MQKYSQRKGTRKWNKLSGLCVISSVTACCLGGLEQIASYEEVKVYSFELPS